jgi:hypothetical protein
MTEKIGLWFWGDEGFEVVIVLEPQSLINIRYRIAEDLAKDRFRGRFSRS